MRWVGRGGFPAMWSGGLRTRLRVAEDGLQLEELLEARLAPLAAVARLFVAAEGGAQVGLRAVHVDVAGADLPGHPARALEVAGGHVAREPVGRVVGDADRVRLVLVWDDGEDRPEDLLARDRHVVADVGEYRGLHEVPLADALRAAGAARHELRALLDALLDETLHLLELRLARERADGGALGERVPHLYGLGGALRRRGGLGHPGARDEHTRGRVARLAGVESAALHAGRDRLLEVGVVQDDVGRLTAELLRDALPRRGGGRGDGDARPGGAGEGDHVDVRVRRNGGAHGRPVAVHHVEDAGGDARLVEDVGEQVAGQRRDLARLEHHRAPRRQRRRHLAGDLVHGPVPRGDEAADADGLPAHERRAPQLLELEAPEHLRHLEEVGEPGRGLRRAREPDRRPHLLRDGLGHLLVLRLVDLDDALDEREALLGAGLRVRLEGTPGGGDRLVDVGGRAERYPGDRVLGGGVDDREVVRPRGRHPLPVDVELAAVLHVSPPVMSPRMPDEFPTRAGEPPPGVHQGSGWRAALTSRPALCYRGGRGWEPRGGVRGSAGADPRPPRRISRRSSGGSASGTSRAWTRWAWGRSPAPWWRPRSSSRPAHASTVSPTRRS